MYSSSSSATHHIFFPPRLQVVVEQENPNGFPSHLGDQFSFDDLLGHQPHRPSSAPSGWSAANHGNDQLLLAATRPLLDVACRTARDPNPRPGSAAQCRARFSMPITHSPPLGKQVGHCVIGSEPEPAAPRA